ncbi:flotillin family protein [Mycobacterium marinum]|uniref:SPFH domain-containing protein n=1 Tax=Mycobacterium marinum TaxID=1781 RepID=UPI0021C4B485|nr:flotillin family protein [Mycobacterium marinum]GJN95263.1 flotillin family protein [Mycobacterium marinum]GJO05385.1 flotillin family protein [Mycobacterium marinum]GJO26827.1 flotillin family protein [Mycobacterium marinum]GJO40644.1 flotillin family protein [Mycobacterium marinum]GJO48948.1 flotillin family protein [Mycobacterium marinum]
MLGYKVPDPDEAMLISGGRVKGNAPFRVVTGHGSFVVPFFRKVRFLTLAMCEAEVAEKCVTQQGITLNVRAVIAFKVGNDTESIIAAAQRFLSEQDQMSVLTGRIFAGHLRSIIGTMTVEEIIRERQKLATEVLDGSKEEMARIGLNVDALQIQSIDDDGLGYIDAMSAPHNAAIQQQAQIAQAQANQLSAEAEQESQRKQAEFARETAIVKAQYKAEVDKAQAQAAQAGPLAEAQSQREVLEMRTELAERAAELRQQELVAEVVKPAEAEAERVRILAVADAEKMKIQAEAAASHNRVALDRMLIDQLPDIVEKAALGLSGANLTVLNGADGLSQVAAGLVSQGVAIFDAMRGSVADDNDGENAVAPWNAGTTDNV